MQTPKVPTLVGLALATLLLGGTGARAHVIIFKDGFMLYGQVKQPGSFTADAATGQAVWITGGFFVLDSPARRIFFSPHQVQDVSDKDPFAEADVVRLESRITRYGVPPIYPLVQIVGADPWDEKWDRKFKLNASFGRVHAKQHLGLLTPYFLRVDARNYNWSSYYLPSEWGPSTIRSLINSYPELKSKSERDAPAWRFKVARYLMQAGWYDQAEEELAAILKALPDEKEKVEAIRETLKKLRALQLYDDIERAHQAGQFQWVEKNLGRFPRDHPDEKLQMGIRALKTAYETAGDNLKLARRFLKDLPARCDSAHRKLFAEAAAAISNELDNENVGRLDAFLTLAQQAERDQKQKGNADKEPDQLLALAVSGWVLGKESAEAKVDVAKRLWKARQFVLQYQRTDDEADRAHQLKTYQAEKTEAVPIDEMTQIIGFLPPPTPEKKIGTEPMELRTELPDGPRKGLPYVVQLPPEYHHSRRYPVLFALHQGGETPDDMRGRVAALAAQNGYIVVAPEWVQGRNYFYSYSAEEHATVTDVLRDLRRRFQVDSDRVFLMGFGEGANMAFDVGLSHPDLFAGVLPVSGMPRKHAEKYWPNALSVPFYVVDGSSSRPIPDQNQELFKKWVPLGYPALYVQYRGRGLEWFAGELPSMFDWMNHKKDLNKRSTGVPELARAGGSLKQDFQMMRSTDNRFYWASTDAIQPRNLIDGPEWTNKVYPATLQGRIGESNMIFVNPQSLKQLTVWLAKDMIDFSKPVTVRVNNTYRWSNKRVPPSMTTLLEDLYSRGDRQRLFWAKLDFDLLR